MGESEEYELVAAYGFSAKCPRRARLEFNPKSRREKGDIAFHHDDGFKIFLSWGSLEEAKKKYATAADQAAGSIEHSLKSARAKLEGATETKTMKILGHDAAYIRARMCTERGGFPFGSRRVVQDAVAMYIHCEETERYYVVYAFSRPQATDELLKAIEPMMASLKCH